MLGSLGSKVIFPSQPKTHFFGDIVDFAKSCELCSAADDFRKAERASAGQCPLPFKCLFRAGEGKLSPEGHCPAEFNSNPIKTHLNQLIN